MREVVQGIWQLAGLPPNGMNVYLADGVLFDTGTRFAHRRILRQLRGREVWLVAVTHAHPDHIGSVQAVSEALQVPVACHERDAEVVSGERPMSDNMPSNPLSAAMIRLFNGPAHPVDRVLSEGDSVGELTVVHAPGHSPGHVIYYRERDRVAIAGDVLFGMNLLTLIPGLREPPAAFTIDAEANRRSIRRLAELEPQLVCWGHGPPLREPEKLAAFAGSR